MPLTARGSTASSLREHRMSAEWPAALARSWHPIAYGRELRDRPLAVRLMDRPLALFRGRNGIGLVEDRCPHRNAPLSAGRVEDGLIACPYHGWRFDEQGRCGHTPGSTTPARHKAPAFSVREDGALIWASLASAPGELPALPSEVTDPGFDSFWWPLPASRAAIADAIENLLDPVHAYFLHPGLVRRSRGPQQVAVEFNATVDGAAARYAEPAAQLTLLQRLTEGRRTASWGRYDPPARAQILFEDRLEITASITVIFTPVAREETRPFACFSTRRGLAPAWLKRWFIIAFHRRVLAQDVAMLALQSEQSARFGCRNYHNGPIDLFGPAIWAGLNGKPIEPVQRQLVLA